MKAGFGRADITPPLGTYLSGQLMPLRQHQQHHGVTKTWWRHSIMKRYEKHEKKPKHRMAGLLSTVLPLNCKIKILLD